jgi:hypothetical protein
MSGFTMTVGNRRFIAKSVQRIVKNFCRWRDITVNGVNTIGTHWEVRSGGKTFGEVVFDGTFRPFSSTDRPPWSIVDDLLAENFKTDHEHSREYMAGVRAALEWRLMRSPMGCPFPAGSVEADAFVAGREKGTRIETGLEGPRGNA